MFEEPRTAESEAGKLPPEWEPTPTDDEVDRLSSRIGEVHAAIGKAHTEASEFARTNGATRPGHPEVAPDPGDEQGDLLARLGPAAGYGREGHLLYEAYTARGQARLARCEDDLALIDFGMALHFSPVTFMHYDKYYGPETAEAWEGRNLARAGVAIVLATAEAPDASDRGTLAAETGKFRIAPGYLVVGLDAVLIREPLTVEGRSAAIAHADRLAREVDARAVFDDHYLVDSVEFDLFVYEHDGSSPRLIYSAPMQEDRSRPRRHRWR